MWEGVAKHGKPTLGLFSSCLVLYHIPMLDQDSILDPEDVCRDPVRGRPELRKTPMDHHEIAFGHNYARLIPECWRETFDEVKQSLASRLNVSTVLDVVGRPESLRRC